MDIKFYQNVMACVSVQLYTSNCAVLPYSLGNFLCSCTIADFLTYPSYVSDKRKSGCGIHSFISIQPWRPGWQEPELSHVTVVALAHCILGKVLGVVCHCFPPPLDIPTFAARSCGIT